MRMEFPDNRRTFIKKSAAFFGGFAVLFAVGKPEVVKPKQASEQPEPSRQGYRLTEHIRKYYEKASI
jgi:hypothetical protein